QTPSVQEFLESVLANLVNSLGAHHGVVRLVEGEGAAAKLVARAAVGFSRKYLAQYGSVSASEPWVQKALQEDCRYIRMEDEPDRGVRQRMAEAGVKEMITLSLPGAKGRLGMISIAIPGSVKFKQDELSYLVNLANLIGLTLQNVRLFEQVTVAQQQWAYTFDSLGEPIVVEETQGRVVRANQRLNQLLGREGLALVGRSVLELLPIKRAAYKACPYCEGVAGEGDDPDPWLPGYFLASNS